MLSSFKEGVPTAQHPMPDYLFQKNERYEMRINSAGKAIALYGRRIINAEDLTPEISTELGWRYACYEFEYDLHAEDSAREIAERQQVAGYPFDLWGANDWQATKTKLESALAPAFNGNYIFLRNYLRDRGQGYINIYGGWLEKGYPPLTAKWRRICVIHNFLGRRLIDMSELIPNTGRPLDIPPPSWADIYIATTVLPKLPSLN